MYNNGFNWRQYLTNYNDLQKSGINNYKDALNHYMQFGKEEGRTYLPLHEVIVDFNWRQYIHNYKDLSHIDNYTDAFIHYKTIGKTQNRTYINQNNSILQNTIIQNKSETFDWKQYILNYPDLQKNGIHNEITAINHYMKNGINEGRTYISLEKIDFDAKQYIDNYDDLKNVVDPWDHYINTGKYENRTYMPITIQRYSDYDIKTYDDFIYDTTHNKIIYGVNTIPKIIFKSSSFKTYCMPLQIIEVLEITKKLNPEYTLYYFDDDDIDRFIQDYYSDIYIYYKQLNPGAYRSDFWRYCILYKYGGFYSDIGHVMNMSFDSICNNNTQLLLVKDINNCGIHNSLMGTIKNNILFKNVLDVCVYNIRNQLYGVNDLDITGPYTFGREYLKYIRCNYKINSDNTIHFDMYIHPTPHTNITILFLNASNKNENKKIITLNNDVVLYIKFKNYKNIMYRFRKHYLDYWTNKNVYNNPNHIPDNAVATDSMPNNIFQTYTSYDKVKESQCIKSWNHIDFNYYFYTDSMADVFMKKEFKGDVYQAYIKLNRRMKRKLWRYCIIYFFGGIYVNTNKKCEIGIHPHFFLKKTYNISVVPYNHEYLDCSFFSACKRSDILHSVIHISAKRIIEKQQSIEYYDSSLIGKEMFNYAIEIYIKNKYNTDFDIKKLYTIPENTIYVYQPYDFNYNIVHTIKNNNNTHQKSSNTYIVLLTTAVNSGNKHNKDEIDYRISLYTQQIRAWLINTSLHIFCIESTGYIFEIYNPRFHQININLFEKSDSDTVYNSSTILELQSLHAFFKYNHDINIDFKYTHIIKVTGRYYLEDIENKLKDYKDGLDVYLQKHVNHEIEWQNTEYYIMKKELFNDFVSTNIAIENKQLMENMFYTYIACNKLKYMFIGPFPNNIPRGGDKFIITEL